jgi:hypothetical protein
MIPQCMYSSMMPSLSLPSAAEWPHLDPQTHSNTPRIARTLSSAIRTYSLSHPVCRPASLPVCLPARLPVCLLRSGIHHQNHHHPPPFTQSSWRSHGRKPACGDSHTPTTSWTPPRPPPSPWPWTRDGGCLCETIDPCPKRLALFIQSAGCFLLCTSTFHLPYLSAHPSPNANPISTASSPCPFLHAVLKNLSGTADRASQQAEKRNRQRGMQRQGRGLATRASLAVAHWNAARDCTSLSDVLRHACVEEKRKEGKRGVTMQLSPQWTRRCVVLLLLREDGTANTPAC